MWRQLTFWVTVVLGAEEDVALWRNCLGPVGAYSGAWLARRDTFMETRFGNMLGMEYHDYFMYHQGGNGHPRVALKSADVEAFYVDHLSQYEHAVMSKHTVTLDEKANLLDLQTRVAAEAECDALGDLGEDEQAYPSGALPVLAIVPFWGGAPEVDSATGKVIGNSHSQISRELKLRQLRGVLCSVKRVFPAARLVVAVANPADAASVADFIAQAVTGGIGPALFEVLEVKCIHGAYLTFSAFREVQRRLDLGHWATDYIYFTEADQIVRRNSLSVKALLSALGQHVYVSPNRLHVPYPMKSGMFAHSGLQYHFDLNICNGELVATHAARAAAAPQLSPGVPEGKNYDRGGRMSWPAASRDPRAPINERELADAMAAMSRRAALFATDPPVAAQTYASAKSQSNRRTRTYEHAFIRCRDEEKAVSAWFSSRESFLKTDFDRIKQPLKNLPLIVDHLLQMKRSSSWHIWALATAHATHFATCHACRGEFPPLPSTRRRRPSRARRQHATPSNDDAPLNRVGHRRKSAPEHGAEQRPHGRRLAHAPTLASEQPCGRFDDLPLNESRTVALMAMPSGGAHDSLQAATARRSVCASLETFGAVVVGACASEDGSAPRLGFEDGLRGVTVWPVKCVSSHDTNQLRAEHQTAVPLLQRAWSELGNWSATHVFFAPVGDIVAVDDLDSLKAAVSPNAFLIAHRFHDAAPRKAAPTPGGQLQADDDAVSAVDEAKRAPRTVRSQPHECENATRDWIAPLSFPNRSDISADTTLYYLIPR